MALLSFILTYMDHSGSMIPVTTKVDALLPPTLENDHVKFEDNRLETVGEINVLKKSGFTRITQDPGCG